jgi:hypothetical protein
MNIYTKVKLTLIFKIKNKKHIHKSKQDRRDKKLA